MKRRPIKDKIHRLGAIDWDRRLFAGTIVVGTPTVLAGPHPLAAHAAFLANALRPKTQYLSIVGSYGWRGKTVEALARMIANLKVEVLEPVLCKGVPEQAAFSALEQLADTIAQKHKESGFRSYQQPSDARHAAHLC